MSLKRNFLKPLYESPDSSKQGAWKHGTRDWSSNVERILYPPKVR